MVKARGPMPGQVRPQQLHQLVQQKKAEGLNKKEAQQAKLQKAEKATSSDAGRLASQAGFQRLTKKSKKGFDIGDGGAQRYALPDEDTQPDAWSQERLEGAQGSLSLASSQFGQMAGAEGATASLGASVIGSSYMPTEEDLEEMEDLARRKPPKPLPMLDEMSHSVSALFGIELDEDVPIGHKVLAAGLVVAGEQGSVNVDKGKLEEKTLADGIQKVTKRGNQAVGEAQRMNKGINQQLNLQRTFVFKR